jgi:hypothetical protein
MNEPVILSEWTWQASWEATEQHVIRDNLVWRDMILGTIEAFSERGPWYGNVGCGRELDFDLRCVSMSLDSCRLRVEANVLRVLLDGCNN